MWCTPNQHTTSCEGIQSTTISQLHPTATKTIHTTVAAGTLGSLFFRLTSHLGKGNVNTIPVQVSLTYILSNGGLLVLIIVKLIINQENE